MEYLAIITKTCGDPKIKTTLDKEIELFSNAKLKA